MWPLLADPKPDRSKAHPAAQEPPSPPDDAITLEQAAEVINSKPDSVLRLLENGHLKPWSEKPVLVFSRAKVRAVSHALEALAAESSQGNDGDLGGAWPVSSGTLARNDQLARLWSTRAKRASTAPSRVASISSGEAVPSGRVGRWSHRDALTGLPNVSVARCVMRDRRTARPLSETRISASCSPSPFIRCEKAAYVAVAG